MDTVRLDRKVAIIAGASRGMGREIAIAYALAGPRGGHRHRRPGGG